MKIEKSLFLDLLAEFAVLKQLKVVTAEEFQTLMETLKKGDLKELTSIIFMMGVENPHEEFERINDIISEHETEGGNYERRTESIAG